MSHQHRSMRWGGSGGVSFGDDVGLEHQVMRHCAGHGFREVPWKIRQVHIMNHL